MDNISALCRAHLVGGVYYVKVANYDMASRIICECGTCSCSIKGIRLNVVNVKIIQHVFVVICIDYNRQRGTVLVVIVWQLDFKLPMQLVLITSNVVSSNPV